VETNSTSTQAPAPKLVLEIDFQQLAEPSINVTIVIKAAIYAQEMLFPVITVRIATSLQAMAMGRAINLVSPVNMEIKTLVYALHAL